MIKKKLLSVHPSIGTINLHTGLSPYIKGGPNCTNWCISTGQVHLIGNTVMWIDEGIDSGNIISTELTAFEGNESLLDVHIKVMEHAHDLYIGSIRKLIEGARPGVRQNEIGDGKTYYSKQWGLKQKFNLIKNFKIFKTQVNSAEYARHQTEIKTISL